MEGNEKPRAMLVKRIVVGVGAGILVAAALIWLSGETRQQETRESAASADSGQQDSGELQKGNEKRQRAIAIVLRDYEPTAYLAAKRVPEMGYQDAVDRDGWQAYSANECQNCVELSLNFMVTDNSGKSVSMGVFLVADLTQRAVVSMTMPTSQWLRPRNSEVRAAKIDPMSVRLTSSEGTQLMRYLGTLYLIYGTQFHGGRWTETELECPDPTHQCFRLTYKSAASNQPLSWLIEDDAVNPDDWFMRPENEEAKQLDRLSRRYPDAEIYWTCAGIGCPYCFNDRPMPHTTCAG